MFDLLNGKYEKEEKIDILKEFYDTTSTLLLFWNDVFGEFEIMLMNTSPLIKKYKYFRKNTCRFI